MQLYQDNIFTVELPDSASCVVVKWHDMEFFNLSDFELAFHTLMAILGEYNIKNVIMDMSQTLTGLPDKFYSATIDLLMSGFSFHQVQKLGRIASPDSCRESRTFSYISNLIAGMQLELKYQVFNCRQSALQWVVQDCVLA